MKRLLLVSLFLLVVSAPMYAQYGSINCYSYPDTVAFTGPATNYCYSRGAVCVQCVYLDMWGGGTCSVDWDICNPIPGPKGSPGLKALLKPHPHPDDIQMALLRPVARESARTASRVRRVSKLRPSEIL